MSKIFDTNALIMLIVNVLYIFILSTLNNEIAPYVYIILPAIFIIPSALFLKSVPMVIVVGFTAYLSEVTTSIPTGFTPALWILSAGIIHNIRYRFRALDWFSLTSLSLCLNLIILFIYTICLYRNSADIISYIVRVSTDVLFSSIILVLAGNFAIMLPINIANLLKFKMSID